MKLPESLTFSRKQYLLILLAFLGVGFGSSAWSSHATSQSYETALDLVEDLEIEPCLLGDDMRSCNIFTQDLTDLVKNWR